MNAAEKLAKDIITNYNNPLQSNTIDLPGQVEFLPQNLGATTSDSGGKVTYYGSDPIKPDRLPYGTACAIALAVKAILIAKIWKGGWQVGGKVLGILGMGRVGQSVARRTRGFGMKIHYSNGSKLPAEIDGG